MTREPKVILEWGGQRDQRRRLVRMYRDWKSPRIYYVIEELEHDALNEPRWVPATYPRLDGCTEYEGNETEEARMLRLLIAALVEKDVRRSARRKRRARK